MKEFLSQHGVDYQDRDVSHDDAAFEDLSRLGYMTTPVITIDDHVVVGFNRGQLDELLGLGPSGGPTT